MAALFLVRTVAELGARLRERRKKNGLSQTELADLLGTTQRWISQIENGKESAEIGMVLRMARFLDLQISVGETPPRVDGARLDAAKALLALARSGESGE